MSVSMSELVKPLGVECVDGQEIRKIIPARILNGWELKPYSIINCPFKRVLLLDADCVAIKDPSFLFETEEFIETGAIFWPDFGRLESDREIWSACGIEYRDEPEFESGQIVVDKQRVWKELSIAMHLNEHSDFYYDLIHGDKETFHMSFAITGKPYSMPSRGIDALESTMCQHDFQGTRIFQHRNMDKWDIWGNNNRIKGFEYETDCFEFLRELREKWEDSVDLTLRYDEGRCNASLRNVAEQLIGSTYKYVRVGHDSRTMTFLSDGMIGVGRGACEIFWNVHEIDGIIALQISGSEKITCTLHCVSGSWQGRWAIHEKMPVEIYGIIETD